MEGTYLRHPGVTAPGAAPTLSRMDDVDEAAAWRELKAAIGEALWHYAEAVTGATLKISPDTNETPNANSSTGAST